MTLCDKAATWLPGLRRRLLRHWPADTGSILFAAAEAAQAGDGIPAEGARLQQKGHAAAADDGRPRRRAQRGAASDFDEADIAGASTWFALLCLQCCREAKYAHDRKFALPCRSTE